MAYAQLTRFPLFDQPRIRDNNKLRRCKVSALNPADIDAG
eukprot:CAMPEP_0177783342 /NCGR_PEP_ID=MMETSP0491_2-20121128/19046_1 /TAXON_ID=63592 /ORGANISM="Tetraselmis chuii, Strain PLY429" /LENGTH=39 /DNA_ID= /DNA_START= /DNA_END= /DNA_ORIENTATION=